MQRERGGQSPGPSEAEVKVVVVGDGGCGKTSLLLAFAKGDFPKGYVPTVFEKYTASLRVGGEPVTVHLWDTAGQEDYDRLRPLSYSGADVVLICFDVTDPSSYDNVLTKWYPEVNHFCKGVPVLLVGCKTDLRRERTGPRKPREGRRDPVSHQQASAAPAAVGEPGVPKAGSDTSPPLPAVSPQGVAMARQVRAVSYVECSARYQENVGAIFAQACGAALGAARRNRRRGRPRRGCVLC
ncbi:rho-related GTP-binding protein RhoF-like [Chlamydotis macqueenii]